MRRLIVLATLSLMAMLVLAPTAMAQTDYEGGAGMGEVSQPQNQYAPTTAAEAVDEETSSTTTTTPLPDTGGPSLLLPVAGFLVLGVGLVAVSFARRTR